LEAVGPFQLTAARFILETIVFMVILALKEWPGHIPTRRAGTRRRAGLRDQRFDAAFEQVRCGGEADGGGSDDSYGEGRG
jgi:hypothetical protein